MSGTAGRNGPGIDAPSILDVLPRERRDQLMAQARARTFRDGDIVFHEGDPAGEMHVVEAGHFTLHVTLPGGEEAMLGVVGPGDVFGEMAPLHEDGERAATVRAAGAATTRAIDGRQLRAMLAQEPALAMALLQVLADKVRAGDARLLEALFVPAETRVLRRLRDVAMRYPAAADGSIEVPLRQEDLAALAGTSRGTVNRVLRDAERRGHVVLGRAWTRLVDPAALADETG